MTFALPEILFRLRPGAKWRLPDIHDYETLEWNDESQTKPTLEELTVNYQELIDAQPFKYFREERNKRLDQSDKYIVADYPHPTPEKKQEWFDYRQALRDLPTATEDPANPVWPVPPE